MHVVAHVLSGSDEAVSDVAVVLCEFSCTQRVAGEISWNLYACVLHSRMTHVCFVGALHTLVAGRAMRLLALRPPLKLPVFLRAARAMRLLTMRPTPNGRLRRRTAPVSGSEVGR